MTKNYKKNDQTNDFLNVIWNSSYGISSRVYQLSRLSLLIEVRVSVWAFFGHIIFLIEFNPDFLYRNTY